MIIASLLVNVYAVVIMSCNIIQCIISDDLNNAIFPIALFTFLFVTSGMHIVFLRIEKKKKTKLKFHPVLDLLFSIGILMLMIYGLITSASDDLSVLAVCCFSANIIFMAYIIAVYTINIRKLWRRKHSQIS